jgi:translation initiation factor IF-2
LEAVLAKGIRVNQLAKELGVASKDILEKCRAEGVEIPNHMTVLSVGLSETVREWFAHGAGGSGGTAVETAPPVEVAAKPKTARARTSRKKAQAEGSEEGAGGVATAEAPAAAPREGRSQAPAAEAPPAAPPVVEAPAVHAPFAPEQGVETSAAPAASPVEAPVAP